MNPGSELKILLLLQNESINVVLTFLISAALGYVLVEGYRRKLHNWVDVK